MKRKEFQNLPSTETPINAENLNEMQDNIEESCVVVSPTEPTTNEKVWIQKSNNIYGGGFELGGYNLTTGVKTTSTETYRNTKPLYIKPNTEYVFSSNGVMIAMNVLEYKSDGTFISNTTINGTSFTSNSETSYINFFRGTNPSNFQIEQGSTATEYEAYVEKAIYVKNDNGVYKEFYKENKSKILWTNPNPTASIGYTYNGITLSSEDYDELEFWCNPYSSGKELLCTKTKKGYNASINKLDGYIGNMWARGFEYVSNTAYTIQACYAYGKDYPTPPIETNGNLIPLFVIGYKN